MLAIGNWGNGDADKDKILTDIADDQLDVVSRGFLGLTVACARCHDHKFDPISQADYYGLAGIFFSTHILPELTPKGAGETIMRVPLASDAELERRKEHARRVDELETQLAEESRARSIAFARSLRPEAARYLMALYDYEQSSDSSLDDFAAARGLHAYALRRLSESLGAAGYATMATPVTAILGDAAVHAWKGPGDTPSLTVNTADEPKQLLTFRLPARSASVHPGPSSGVVVAWSSPVEARVRVAGRLADGDPAGGDGVAWAVDHRSAGGLRQLAAGDIPNGGSADLSGDRLASIAVRPGDRIELVVLPKGSHTCDTTNLQWSIIEQDGPASWVLAADIVDDPVASNPHADRLGHDATWHFQETPDTTRPAFDADRVLARRRMAKGDRRRRGPGSRRPGRRRLRRPIRPRRRVRPVPPPPPRRRGRPAGRRPRGPGRAPRRARIAKIRHTTAPGIRQRRPGGRACRRAPTPGSTTSTSTTGAATTASARSSPATSRRSWPATTSRRSPRAAAVPNSPTGSPRPRTR